MKSPENGKRLTPSQGCDGVHFAECKSADNNDAVLHGCAVRHHSRVVLLTTNVPMHGSCKLHCETGPNKFQVMEPTKFKQSRDNVLVSDIDEMRNDLMNCACMATTSQRNPAWFLMHRCRTTSSAAHRLMSFSFPKRRNNW